MNLKTKFFTLMAVVFLAFTVAVWFYSQHLMSQINEMWGARLAEKQVLFDKQRTLQALMREISLSRQMAGEPALIEMALHEDEPTIKARGLEVLERYRPKFQGRSVFAAMVSTGHYYFSDAENKHGKPQPLLTLSPTHSDDHWFYKFVDSKLDYEININPGVLPGTTKVWINVAIRHNNEVVGLIGTGLDITEFIKESIAVEQPGISSVFIGSDLTIQLYPGSKLIDYRLADRPKVDALLTATDVEHLREVMLRLEKTPGQTATLWVTYEGKKHLLGVAYLPEISWFNLSFMDARTSTLLHDFNLAPILVMIFLMALSAMGWMLHRLVLEPVARLKTGMDKVAFGGLNERIAETGKDELSALANCFNEMTTMLSETTVSRDVLSAEVDERKRAEIELRQARKIAEQALAEKSRFMDMLTHELKTPISVVRMALGAMKVDGSLKCHAERALADMNDVVERCRQMDNLERQKLIPHAQRCRMDKILSELCSNSLEHDRLLITTEPLPELSTDPQLLRIILGNLIGNAIKYSPPESAINICAGPSQHSGKPGVRVTIQNQPGTAGVPDLDQVFNKYYRSPGACRQTGSGLGLYLVHSFTELLGGQVAYDVAQGKVRFTLWIPC